MELLTAIWEVYQFACVIFATLFLIGLIRNLRKVLGKQETDELVEKLQQQIKLVYKEQVCGMFHLYDKTTNSFIAQGYTEDEMWANAHLTFPRQEFIIQGEDGKAVLVSVKDEK